MRTLLRISCLLAIFSGIYFFYKYQTSKRRTAASVIVKDTEKPQDKGAHQKLTD